MSRRRIGRTLARRYWGLLAILLISTTICADGTESSANFDCGVNSLFILLQLEGRAAAIDRLESVLPRRHPDGYSMEELLTAGRAMGLSLEGVRFFKGDRALDRPAIVFLKGPKGGHFAVLRPVGTTGTMVQVIDPPHPPRITDYDRLFALRSWTGRILSSRPPSQTRKTILPILSGLSIALTAFLVWRHRRSSRADATRVPPRA